MNSVFPPPSGEKDAARQKSKKRAKRAIWIVLILAVVLVLLYWIPYDAILEKIFEDEDTVNEEIFFYEADFQTDILSDPEYTALNRYVTLVHGNESFVITDGNFSVYGDGAEVIGKYVQCLVNGDADGYNQLFTESYLKENGEQSPFAMQRIYNITAKLYSQHTFTESELDGEYQGITQYRYEVSYAIQYNDGSIRRDMGSGVNKPIYVEILADSKNKTVLINSISLGEVSEKR